MLGPKKIWLPALALTMSLAHFATARCPVADLNGDCRVHLEDLQVLAEQWLVPAESPADLNGDDRVNMADFTLVAAKWRKTGVPLMINEVLASNSSVVQDPQGQYDDWIEIHNYGDQAIDVGGMYLTDDLSASAKWQIPDDDPSATTIPAHGYLLIWVDNDIEDTGLHANFKLDADGEELGLFDTDGGTLIDSIVFAEQTTDISFGRYPDGSDNCRFMASPTPMTQNSGAYLGEVADTKFSHDRGFYDVPFQVRLACDTEDATIRYTVDGSDPVDPNGTIYHPNSPIQITTTTSLCAAAYKPGWLPSNIDTQTYIFIEDVVNQPSTAPGPDWPPPGSWYGQTIDYEMDPQITKSPEYKDLIDDALLSIPSICLSTDLNNLFDPRTGIYVNCGYYGRPGWERGKAWERPVSVELINPDGSEGFQINAGLRMRGITSCGGGNPKHAFRLFFENEYDGSLQYPLFGDEGADEFERVDLRCAQNYSWNLDRPSYSRYFTFVREVFSRDLQRETGQPYTRSRYYHLYINGVYWGLYQTQERAEASYGKTYFGGDNDDYDVVKSNRSWPRSMECIDGNFDAYERLWQACLDGFDTDEKYYKVQGLNPDGTPNPAYERLVDVDNLIDYMLTIFYTGDFDAPICGWNSNRTPNNFFAICSRVNPDGFKYFRHDGEHTMNTDSRSYDRTGPYNHSWLMNFIRDCPEANEVWPAYTCIGFNPQTLHQYLTVHSEYKMKFADHVHRHFFNNGPMTVEGAQQLFASRAAQIDMAIIAESARWGDAKAHPPRIKDDWLSAIAWVLDTYMPTRTSTVISQFKNKGWYPNVDAPEFKVNGSFQHGGYVLPTDSISITSPAGAIYYTLDGSDPRLPATLGGEVTTVTLVTEDAPKKVLVPASDIGTTWRGDSEPYDDSGWTDGTPILPGQAGGVGYERSSGYQNYVSYDVESEMYGKNASCYIRIPFVVDSGDLATFNYMTLKARCDDGFVAYINGVEATSINKPAQLRWDSTCANRADSVDFVELPISSHLSDLHPGDNLLAIHGLNQSPTSSDFLISVELIAGEGASGPGDISPAATEYTGPITLTETTQVKARVLSGSMWSALNKAIFAIGPVAENLRITEVMYHPQPAEGGNDPNEEFIELQNIGVETINLNLVRFTNGIDFTFPSMELAAGEYVLVVKDLNAFEARYGPGLNIAGQYSGNLRNGGERIELEDAAGQSILNFRYRDGWYDITDGMGFSLTVKDPVNTEPNAWNDKSTWRPSANIGGSPGWDDTDEVPALGSVKINELLAHSHAAASDWIELHNTTGEPIHIGGWFLSDNSDDLMKYEIADGMWIDPSDYIIFYQNQHFGNIVAPGCHSSFALSEDGETLYLHSGRDGVLTGYSEEEKFGASETGVAFGRYEKSTGTYNFVAMSENTPGSANAYPMVGPTVINEIMYHPQNDGDAEYVELLNISGGPIDLQEWDNQQGKFVPWRLTDEGGISFDFPVDTIMAAGEHILLVRNLSAFESEFGAVPGGVQVFEWSLGKLDNGSEKVQLSKPGDEVEGTRYYIRVDRVNYSDGSHPVGEDPWPTEADGAGSSLSRIVPSEYGNDVINWKATSASPGTINP